MRLLVKFRVVIYVREEDPDILKVRFEDQKCLFWSWEH